MQTIYIPALQNRKIKIAVYSGEIPSTTFIENLIEVLTDAGFEIYLFGKRTRPVEYGKSIKIFPTPSGKTALVFFTIKESVKLLFKSPGLFLKCWKTILRNKKGFYRIFKSAGFILPVLNNRPDIFHIQWAKTVEKHSELFELLDSKIALSLRGAHINYSPLSDSKLADAYRKYFPIIGGFHAVSKAIAVESLKYGAVEDRIKVIHSSIKPDLLKLNAAEYNPEKEVEIISIGRHHWKKGYDYALDAMKILKDKKIKFRYTIVAQGDIPEEILFLLNDYKFGKEVEIRKGMPHEDLIEFILKKNLFLLPSLEEGIANVVLEAMAVGIPVITTDCGGMSEIINDSKNGYIVPVRNPELIADKIINFINSEKEEKEKIIRNAKQTIEAEFSREKQSSDFRKFYYSLASL